MGFRRNSVHALRWERWVETHRDELVAAGVPDEIYSDEFRWLRFLEHGYDHESGWTLRMLSERQVRQLRDFVATSCPSEGTVCPGALDRHLASFSPG